MFAACSGTQCGSDSREFGQAFPLPAPEKNSLIAKWADKEILDSLLIDDMEGGRTWAPRIRDLFMTYNLFKDVSGVLWAFLQASGVIP